VEAGSAVAAAVAGELAMRERKVELWQRFRSSEELVRRAKRRLKTFKAGPVWSLAGLIAILLASVPALCRAQQVGQKTFDSPEQASKALVDAEQENDEKAMLKVLGPDANQIVRSGDPTQDEQNRATFVKKYEVMHRFVAEPGGTVLYIGAENWPFPIPLAKNGDQWYFDTPAGKAEIVFRRIGHNELSAIRVCQELVAAEKEYFSKKGNQYAQKFVSDEGKQNGLFWVSADKQSESPIGPLVANAGSDAVVGGNPHGHEPFRGYHFRLLVRQGGNAPGGAMDYVTDGRMTKGFALVAYPAAYRDSGVMTFIVNQDGIVYEKDLGKNTASLAKDLKEYNPDSTWRRSEIAQQLAQEHSAK
jgi:hypothetical protein